MLISFVGCFYGSLIILRMQLNEIELHIWMSRDGQQKFCVVNTLFYTLQSSLSYHLLA